MRGGRQRVGDVCRAAPDPRVFDGPVEEESIPPERPAECSAVVVARKFSARARIIKVVGRFEVAIPVIPKGRAVELIRPGLAHHHGLTSHDAAIFSRKGVGQDAVFLNAIESERLASYRGGGDAGAVPHVRPVQRIAVGTWRGAAAAEPGAGVRAAGDRPAYAHSRLYH